jgi:tight adherence protein B
MAFVALIVASISAVLSSFMMVSAFAEVSAAHRVAYRLRAQRGVSGKEGLARMLARGFPPLRLPARWLSRLPVFTSFLQEVHRLLAKQSICCELRSLGELATFSLLIVFLLLWILLDSALSALLMTILAVLVAGCAYARRDARRAARLLEQLPDAMRWLGICATSGLTLTQAFEHTAEGLRAPLADEFAQVVCDLQTGKGVEEALKSLSVRVALPEMDYLSVALSVHKRTGGPLHVLLERSAEAATGSANLRRTLRVQTAQARLSVWIVTLMPLGILLVVSCVSPGYLAPFFTSVLGFALFGGAVSMEVAGVAMVRRILGLKVL